MDIRKINVITAIFICVFAAAQFVFADNNIAGESAESTTETITETIVDESAKSAAEIAVETIIGESAESTTEITAEETVDESAKPKVKAKKVKTESEPESAEHKIKTKKPKSDESGEQPGESTKEKSAKNAAKKEKEKDGTEFKLSGFLETGFDINRKVNRSKKDDETVSRALAKGEIEISARPVKRVRAEIGIEYNMRDTFVTMDKFYGQYGVTDNGAVRAGIMKKMFGLEERAGTADRYFRSRSIISDTLKGHGFLGHDLTLQYRHAANENLRLAGGFSWSVADSLRYLQNYSAQYDMKDMTFVLAAIIRHYDIPERTASIYGVEGVAVTFASSLSARYESKFCISDAELTLGTNPRIKIMERNRDALILGIRAQEQFPIEVKTKTLRQIIPVAELAMYWDDLDKSGDYDTQLRLGMAFGFAKKSALQLRNTFGTTWRTANGETNVRRYRYDSEVVVIF